MNELEQKSAARLSQLKQDRGFWESVQIRLEKRTSPILGLTPEEAAGLLTEKRSPLEGLSAAPPSFLEAIVRRVGRPPMEIRDGAIIWEPPGELPIIAEQARLMAPMADSVGRIDFLTHDLTFGGTGWVLEADGNERLIVTNRHVALAVCRRTADGRGVLSRSPWNGARYGLEVDFNEEPGRQPRRLPRAAMIEAAFIAEDLQSDAALLRIASAGNERLPDPLPLSDRDATDDEVVALIGYPAWDSRNDPTAMAAYFRDLYDVKRFSPGRIVAAAGRGVISHDCTSLGGSSGSPLLSVDSRRVVGLHFAGRYGVANSAVGVETLKELLRTRRLAPVTQILGRQDAETRNDGRTPAADLADRQGFDPGFLGDDLVTPWPILSDDLMAGLAKPTDATPQRPYELRYTHFGVMFSERLKLPVMTAVNIDGGRAVRLKRGRDRWFFDERIPVSAQFTSQDYNHRGIDRGHMVRREDPNWGELAAQANSDTFHLTNAAPQHSSFNRSAELWLGLESYILESSRTWGFKASVFTGAVHLPDDPPLVEDGMPVPLEYWKLAVMRAADSPRLHATAWLLSQGQLVRRMLEERNRREAREGFVLGPFRTFQISVEDLGKALGYDLGPYIEADPFRAEQERVEDARTVVREIRTREDLIL
ncbi:DNA/RNA non-specific endonuclease [Brevundimonas diminuta ATCC 11568]